MVGCNAKKSADWESLSEAHARTLAALCDQIIPADDFPSASQAGVVNFIDRQLARHYAKHQKTYRDGLDAIDAKGHVPVPQKPGLGAEIDWDWIDKRRTGMAVYE